MFDFRYHAVSLVAVLVALVLGLLLGVAIGDAGLVSSARDSVRDSLRGDVQSARREAADARGALATEQRYSRSAYPLLVSGRLTGMRVGLLFLGEPDESVAGEVRQALTGTGGRLTGTLSLRMPPDLRKIAADAGMSRYAGIESDPALLDELGRRLGIQLAQGGQLLRDVAEALLTARSGTLGPFDAIVVLRDPPKLEGDDARHSAALEDGIIDGLTANPLSVVGVQRTSSKPSQIGWMRERELSTVDNVDQVAGRAALVFALAGTRGSFGLGPEAQALLPGAESIR